MADRLDQLCWNCKKCLKNCDWSREFKPIDGWVAVPKIIQNGARIDHSYKIISCPEFDGEEPKPRNVDIAHYLGISERAFYRLREKGGLPKDVYKKTREFLKEQDYGINR